MSVSNFFFEVSPDITFCGIDGRIIALDLEADRYWALPATLGHMVYLAISERGDTSALPVDLLAALRRQFNGHRGLFDEPKRLFVKRPARHLDLAPVERERNGGLAFAAVASATIFARWLIRQKGIRAAVRHPLKYRSADPPKSQWDEIRSTVRAFNKWRGLVPIERRCLVDSLALQLMLAKEGLPVPLVIGVQANPFAAHCWLQSDDVVIDNELDAVRWFAPLRAGMQ
ncbi:lasso peptide biosynthesis B2 protein [Edaphosphingomonas haloaromaticamans]|uniref:Microcin J25-processing protein McjB C-terminal domain-containing protein n=1 Tax=Edaphosphingomonas haloaromaticamans TaxID=653954 RepID=A0A1S1HIH0_9SPHN|nr:lasso peptide biosynthesis B2 protein [Sphingomonas haloaromaticamans]OHT21642.1 hypothetical protein BHE75_03653 [Sphingomonas haloaromaticamans]